MIYAINKENCKEKNYNQQNLSALITSKKQN